MQMQEMDKWLGKVVIITFINPENQKETEKCKITDIGDVYIEVRVFNNPKREVDVIFPDDILMVEEVN